MPEYIDLPDDDIAPETILRDMLEDISAAIPGWLPSEGNLEVALMEAISFQISEVRRLQSQVPIGIFRFFGEQVVQLAPIDAISSTVRSSWTMVDTDGYTIPSGVLVGLRSSGSDIHIFRVRDSVVVAPGILATLPSQVILESLNPGVESNGIASGAFGELIDTLPFVASIATTEDVSGGLEAETDGQYLNRLADQFVLFSPRAIVPTDFESLARSVPGVSRATAVDGYNPDMNTFDNEKTILVSVIDGNGSRCKFCCS